MRSSRGTGALTEFILNAGADPAKLTKLPFNKATASVNPPVTSLDPMRFPTNEARKPGDRTTGPAAFALDGDQKTAWMNERDAARNNDPAVLTFELPEPFKGGGTVHFNYNLSMNHGGFNSDDTQTYSLGRIRVSVAATLPNALDNLPPLVREELESPQEKRNSEQSARPSHPELLDWLAVEFMESGWDMKHIHRLIVQSATYRQASPATPALREMDPKNRLLARGARMRVPAETVRDIQLATSGLLDGKMGGRSVFPPAPGYLFQRPVSYGPKTWDVEADPAEAKLLLENHKPVTLDLSAHPLPELAAAAAVARILLNLDETITKN